MPKFLIQASYTAEGMQGLLRDKASGRLAASQEAVKSAGGSIESMHYCFGGDDLVIICHLPDAAAAAILGVTVEATGLVVSRATPLLTVAEMDEALSRAPAYRGPGK